MALIAIDNIVRIYNHGAVPVRALDGVTLGVEKGEFTAIVGPSGSGKTTLLNMIGGLDRPTEGTVAIDGVDITSMGVDALIDFRLNHIGFVFQAYNLIPVLTAAENVEFIMLLQGKGKAERGGRTRELLEAVGLADRADARPSELSGGQQQRVAVARALASHPAFVLADEPTANLDGKSAVALLELMEHLNEENGMTFIFSTHDPRVIQRAHRVVTLEDGKISIRCTRRGSARMRAVLSAWVALLTLGGVVGSGAQTQTAEAGGYVKYLFTGSDAPGQEARYDHLVHGRFNARWYPSDAITGVMEMRVRAFYGGTVKGTPHFAETLGQDGGFGKMGIVLWDASATAGYAEMDRMYLNVVAGAWQFTVGRQRVAWGTNLVWNPVDLFNPQSVLDFDYEEKPPVDALRVQYYTGAVSKLEIAFTPGSRRRTGECRMCNGPPTRGIMTSMCWPVFVEGTGTEVSPGRVTLQEAGSAERCWHHRSSSRTGSGREAP